MSWPRLSHSSSASAKRRRSSSRVPAASAAARRAAAASASAAESFASSSLAAERSFAEESSSSRFFSSACARTCKPTAETTKTTNALTYAERCKGPVRFPNTEQPRRARSTQPRLSLLQRDDRLGGAGAPRKAHLVVLELVGEALGGGLEPLDGNFVVGHHRLRGVPLGADGGGGLHRGGLRLFARALRPLRLALQLHQRRLNLLALRLLLPLPPHLPASPPNKTPGLLLTLARVLEGVGDRVLQGRHPAFLQVTIGLKHVIIEATFVTRAASVVRRSRCPQTSARSEEEALSAEGNGAFRFLF
eukprot:1179890-Prorocentrum_minimum.AAC.1